MYFNVTVNFSVHSMTDKGLDITEIFHISTFLYFRLVLLIQYIYIYIYIYINSSVKSKTNSKITGLRAFDLL